MRSSSRFSKARAIWLYTLLALLAISLGACGDKSSAPITNQKPAAELRIAAASDLRYAMDDLIAAFANEAPGVKIEPTYGSSGNFYEQLVNKAPFDLYLSADIAYPRKLLDEKLAEPNSEFTYGVGRLVLWTPKSSGIDVAALGAQALTDPRARKIAIANPRHAPYGRAAEAALKSLGVYESVQDRLVMGENIAQTAEYVASGSADVGLIALSLALAPPLRDQGVYWTVPLDAYPTLEQGGIILAATRQPEAAHKFRDFILSRAGEILARYGFQTSGAE